MKALMLSVLIAMSYAAASQAASPPARPFSDREAVEITFDRNKGQLYALYLRALRDQPGIKGRLDLEIGTNGAGDTTFCRVSLAESRWNHSRHLSAPRDIQRARAVSYKGHRPIRGEMFEERDEDVD